ncbi:MAG: carboxy terminal-processing peptidase, partial [Flavisolibacter sp.]
KLFDLFIEAADPDCIYFTMPDIKTLEKHRLNLDDEINTGNLVFLQEVMQLYKSRIKYVENLVGNISAKPMDFNLAEFYEPGRDTVREANEKLLNEKWYLRFKADVLKSLMGIAANQFASNKTINKTEVLVKESETREKIRNKYLNILKNESGIEMEKELTTMYLNCFLYCMDPHSSFMDGSEKDNFQSHLNTEGYFFGFSIANTSKGEVAITRLAPGGPAWMSGMINKDDIVLRLKWASKEAIDLVGLEADEVTALLDFSNTEKMELTVRKKTGEVQTVVLQKKKLDNDENIVKSFMLNGEKKIGYIMLPAFYTQWEESSGSSCANDVAKEIIKLKKDSISGLILDLRFNGGGSLQEAVEMAGIFIDEGGICQIIRKDGKTVILKDMNRGVIYTGPLIVLVNDYSASASELLAGSLQDYNRALIVGSRTYGKATGQEIKPLSGAAPGFVKLTNLKLYRVTGKSSQMQGVEPDISLPALYQNFGEHEWDNVFAIKPDTINPYKYFKPLKEINKTGLQSLSTSRVANSKFKELENYMTKLAVDMKKEKISMKWSSIEKEIKEGKNLSGEKHVTTGTSVFTASNNKIDLKFINSDEIAKEINKRWLERIGQDPYIEESFSIMLDLIKIN